MSSLTKSIKIKLEAYAMLRGKNKIEALNEALDRALSVNRAHIELKNVFLQIELAKQDVEVQNFLLRFKIDR